MITYNTNMKLILIKFVYSFLFCFIIFFLASCSLLNYEEDKNNTKLSQTDVKKNKCPAAKIPSKTVNYISAKKYTLSIFI